MQIVAGPLVRRAQAWLPGTNKQPNACTFFFTTPQAPKKRFKAQRAFPTKAEGSGLVASFLPGLRAAGLPRLCRGREQRRKEADNTTHGCPAHTGGTEEESVVVSCEYPGGRIKAR